MDNSPPPIPPSGNPVPPKIPQTGYQPQGGYNPHSYGGGNYGPPNNNFVPGNSPLITYSGIALLIVGVIQLFLIGSQFTMMMDFIPFWEEPGFYFRLLLSMHNQILVMVGLFMGAIFLLQKKKNGWIYGFSLSAFSVASFAFTILLALLRGGRVLSFDFAPISSVGVLLTLLLCIAAGIMLIVPDTRRAMAIGQTEITRAMVILGILFADLLLTIFVLSNLLF